MPNYWGLQASVASKTEPLDFDEYHKAVEHILLLSFTDVDPALIATMTVIAGMRYAVHLGKDVGYNAKEALESDLWPQKSG